MMIDNSKEYILCAAVRRRFPRECEGNPYHEGTNDILNIEIGYRHHDIYQRFNDRTKHKSIEECPLELTSKAQGFYTSKGRFVDRYEAMEVAYNAGQVSEKTALGKEWHNVKLSNPDGKDIETIDTHKFNMLFSEDLY